MKAKAQMHTKHEWVLAVFITCNFIYIESFPLVMVLLNLQNKSANHFYITSYQLNTTLVNLIYKVVFGRYSTYWFQGDKRGSLIPTVILWPSAKSHIDLFLFHKKKSLKLWISLSHKYLDFIHFEKKKVFV